MSKSTNILSKLMADQHQPIIEGKTLEEAYNAFQERFQHINLISSSYFIYKAITKKQLNIKDIYKFTSGYQAVFNKVVSLLIEILYYT